MFHGGGATVFVAWEPGSAAFMSKYSDTFDHAMANKVLGLLVALRRNESGGVLYRQIEDMLEQLVSHHSESEHLHLDLIGMLLELLGRQFPERSAVGTELGLLKSRLQPPVTLADLDALRDFLSRYEGELRISVEPDAGPIEEAIQPLLDAYTRNAADDAEEPIVARQQEEQKPISTGMRTASVTAMGSHATPAVPVARESEGADIISETVPISEVESTADSDAVVMPGVKDQESEDSAAAALAHSTPLPTAQSISKDMPSDLAQQVLDAISKNQEFGVLLEVVENELRQVDQVDDIENLRWTVIRQIEKLAGEHHTLATKLDGTHKYLKTIESDSRQLSDELSRVRLLSLTDELTGLPNRRAFLRRLEDEVARVQRYGFPLSMALIDLDKFKEINDQFGHAGGDEVLRIYSKNVLSVFRHHDLVARYGGEEFAVLLANTSTEGSARALEKVKKRASETRWQSMDRMIPVPTFSAGLALYKPGETSSAFIERVDQALYRAKRLGRDRIELDDTYAQEPEALEKRTRSENTSPARES